MNSCEDVLNFRYRYLKRWLLIVISLLLMDFALVLISLSAGEVHIGLRQIASVISDSTSMEYTILFKIRLPRILLAIAVGGALSLAGAILQAIYRNPLVEPYTMGISGGASLGVAIAVVSGLTSVSGYMLPLSGFAGALLSIIVVYFMGFAHSEVNVNNMLLYGVMLSLIASSGIMLIMSLSDIEDMHSIIFWTLGSLDEPDFTLIYTALAVSTGGLFFAYVFARPLNALRLGHEEAQHLGINIERIIKILFVLASVLTGVSVAVAGIIGFIGLVIPHIMRLVAGNDYRILLISSFLGGGLFLMLCDLIARNIISPNELPIGVITGITGGLLFIVLLKKLNTGKT